MDIISINKKQDTTDIFSSKDTWSGFRIEHSICPPMHVPERTLTHHVLQFNFGTPLKVFWKHQGEWMCNTCDTGSVVKLLSYLEKEETEWHSDYTYLQLIYEPSFIDSLLEKENFKFRDQRNITDPLLIDIGTHLYHETNSGIMLEKMYVESLAVSCAIHLTTTYSRNHKNIFAPKGKLSAHQLKKVIDYVRSYIHGVISLEGLAASVHISVFHFSRLFINTVGVSPYQFVLQLKIEHAKRLIKQKASVGEIAYSLGFTDSAHFCNAFKKFTGQSPLQFLYTSIIF